MGKKRDKKRRGFDIKRKKYPYLQRKRSIASAAKRAVFQAQLHAQRELQLLNSNLDRGEQRQPDGTPDLHS